jgi:hypothetical protein
MRKVEITGGVFTGCTAYFHGWGSRNNETGSATVAIIELDEKQENAGHVYMVYPNCVQFLDSPKDFQRTDTKEVSNGEKL